MKKFSVVALGLLLAVSVSAFVSRSTNMKPQKTTTTSMWFDFSGTSESDYDNLDLYTQDPTHDDPCSGNGIRCEILAPVIESGPDAGKPDLSAIEAETKRP
jgi:hypothetical protein